MKTRRFTGIHLAVAVLLTALLCIGGSLLWFRTSVGTYGASMLEALKLVEDKFVGEYDETAAVDAALEGLVTGLGDRWSYYLTEEE